MIKRTEVDAFVRAYTENPRKKRKKPDGGLDEPSDFSLIFDCETTTDPTQSLRFGFFQVRNRSQCISEGIFYEPTSLTPAELSLLLAYAVRYGLTVCTAHEFRFKVFLRVGYEARASIIGCNLPFDISRIATGWGEARGSLRGGFSFEISRSYDDPHVRVKHLSGTMALIDFAKPAGQDTPRGMRRRRLKVAPHRGYFYDILTLASALHSQKFSLARLAKFLEVPTQKHEGVRYDGPLTDTFLDYGRADVQATWECFEKLRDLYKSYNLSTPLHRIASEASIGKACLKDMGIVPLLQCQPDISREVFGYILASYFGGRAEIRIRREVRQLVLCDFKSMYPTVNTLMRLWGFVIADGYSWDDTTDHTQAFLETLQLEQLQDPETWSSLPTLVMLRPQDDVLPLRTRYSDDRDALTIGLNYVQSDQPLWFTLADVAASKILTRKTPTIDRAITFKPGAIQPDLKSLDLLGQSAFRVDPLREDVFKRLVDMRDRAKSQNDPAEHAMKIIANSTSYGSFVEVNRDDAPKPEPLMLYGPDGVGKEIASKAIEQPGKLFHPLLATLITGAARLMLAAAERVATDKGLDWVLCDTDSIGLAKPHGMTEGDFQTRCQQVVDWFLPLNPYAKPGSILKIETENFALGSNAFEPLFAYAISAKRYVLFNIGKDGAPVIRKASAHGLGHLMEPYPEGDAAIGVPPPCVPLHKLGLRRWQYDYWYHLLLASLAGTPNRVRRDYHPALSKPALMQYSATSPALLRWMKCFNEGKSYAAQVKPFGFMVAPMAEGLTLAAAAPIDDLLRGRPASPSRPRPIAPYERDPAVAASRAFDRVSGDPVPVTALKTYAAALRLYHLSAEDKFENGGPVHTGRTERRHLRVKGARLIGKEANRVDDAGMPDPVAASVVVFAVNDAEATP